MHPIVARAMRIVAVAIGICVLPVLNAPPKLFFDTKPYYLLGLQFGEMLKLAPKGAATEGLKGGLDQTEQEVEEHNKTIYTAAGARSPYYAVYIYLLQRLFSLWAIVIVQALVAGYVIDLISRAIFPRNTALSCAVLAVACGAVSTLPLFVDYIMPDFWAGIAFALSIVLIVYPEAVSKLEGWFIVALVSLACLFHLTNAPVLFGTTVVWGVIALLSRGLRQSLHLGRWLRAGSVVLAVTVAGYFAYGGAIRLVKHETMRTPPFLAARVIADGPGRDFLHQVCPAGASYEFCKFTALPLNDANDILWSADPAVSVFKNADLASRIAMIDQQPRFVLDVIRHDPVAVVVSSLKNWWEELFQTDLFEVVTVPAEYLKDPNYELFFGILPGAKRCLDQPGDCDRISASSLSLIDAAANVVGLLTMVVGAVLVRSLAAPPGMTMADRKILLFLLGVVVVLVVNSGVTGMLSGTAPRYQLRAEWLVEVGACVLGLYLLQRAKARRGSDLALTGTQNA